MSKFSISVCKGKGSLGHNNRDFYTPNVDPTRTPLNIVYKQEPLAEAYEKLFGEEVRRYNEGKKPSRQIPDYMEHIRNSKNGEKLFYETVVQVGNRYTCGTLSKDGETAKGILDEYMRDFQSRNPNLYVFNAVLHLDEPDGTPHLHIDWIPVAHNYKNGLQVRNSLDKALKEQGIDGVTSKRGHSTENWQEAEKNVVERVMERHGWEREAESGLHRKHMTVEQFKTVTSEIENQIAVLPEQITAKPVPMSKDKVVVSRADLEALERRAKLSIVHEEAVGQIYEYQMKKQEEVDAYALDRKQYTEQETEKALEAVKEKKAEAQQEATKAFSLKQDLGRRIVEVNRIKSEYEKLHEEQRGLNAAYKEVVAENKRLVAENGSLRAQIAAMRAEFGKKVQEAVEPLKTQIEALKKKMENMALGQSLMMKAMRYVRDNFAGTISWGLLNATLLTGNQWLKEDGFEELSQNRDSYVCKAIRDEIQLDLTYKRGDEGKGLYYDDVRVFEADSIGEARELVPNCRVVNDLEQGHSR